MAWEAAGEAEFTPSMLAGTPVPWTGLGASIGVHLVLVPVLAFGFAQAVRKPLHSRAVITAPAFRYEVVTLKLPPELMKAKQPPIQKVYVSEARPRPETPRPLPKPPEFKPAPVKIPAPAPAPPAPAPPEPQPVLAKIPKRPEPKAFPMPSESRPEKAPVVILQPPTEQTKITRVNDMALPTITMVAPLPPRERKVFDVGSMQKQRAMRKPEERGALPEPPQVASANSIRPKNADAFEPKLQVYAAPPPLETVKPTERDGVSAGGPVVENPANLVMASSRPVPARETVELPNAIVLPKGGNGAANAGGAPPSGTASPNGVMGGTPGAKGVARPTLDGPAGSGNGVSQGKPGASGSTPAGTGAGAPTAGGTGLSDASAPPIRIVHPSTGRHDVMIVHSGVDQILPEARGLLTGDPIYTVYLSVGWSKEWVMHYCIPRDAPTGPRQVGGVVSLGASPPEVRPPYPLTTVVPSQKLVPPPLPMGKKRPPMLFHGYLDAKGTLRAMKLKGIDDSGLADKVLKALETWDMRPAAQGDAPARVQVILVVPMN